MLIYLLCVLIILLFKIASIKNDRLNSIFFICILIYLFFIAGFRGSVGSDTAVYADIYMVYLQENYPVFGFRFEPAFILLMKVCSFFSDDYQLVLIVYSFLQSVFLYLVLVRVRYPFFFILVYVLVFYLQFHLNTIRVGLAVLIFIYSLQQNSTRRSVIFLVLALLNHFSILLLIPIWVIYKNMLNWKVVVALTLTATLLFFAIFDYFLIKVALYFHEKDSKISLGGVALVLFISPFLSYLALSMLRMKISLKMLAYNSLLVISVLGILYVDIFYRLYTLLGFFILFLIANDQLGFKKQFSKVVFSSVFVLSITVPAVHSVVMEQSNVARVNGVSSVEYRYTFIPYSFFFNE
ncbi:hypothetical protein AAY72_06325 [Alishewanella sp. WH16-1]|uniref:EpsG family protein n=1 Tax=Alishewanella sp. WH16-1 TaxID=1651088 RepID=UPI00070A7CCA|nr:EpsG family protein [Alishewanella sp. WH16-1]KRS21860.1 hypothetical protein AAY72_06325 [Alishewanella sp. WH16-1]